MSKRYCMCPPRGRFRGYDERGGSGSTREHATEERERGALVEQVVEVAALRALHAGGAAALARAAGDQARGVVGPRLEDLEAAFRDPDPADVAVVDEDGGPQGLRVEVRREPADVPAVAHGVQRQERD